MGLQPRQMPRARRRPPRPVTQISIAAAVHAAALALRMPTAAGAGGGSCSCFLRSDVVLAKCNTQARVDTWTLTPPGAWTDHPNTNCFTGHGATSLSGSLGSNFTVASCEAACVRHPNCTAVVIEAGASPPPPPGPRPRPPPGPPDAYSYNGYLGSGGFQVAPFLEVGMHTTATARARCDALPTCTGFTFVMEECRLHTAGGRWYNGTTICTEPTRTWFAGAGSSNNSLAFYRYWNCGRRQPCQPIGGTGCVIPPEIAPGSTMGQLMPPRGTAPGASAQWLGAVTGWREACQAEQRYNGSIYRDPALQWTQTSWIQPQVHPYDNFIYDHVSRNWCVCRVSDRLRHITTQALLPTSLFASLASLTLPSLAPMLICYFNRTVGKYLGDLKARFGGIDSVLIWPTYTNLGVRARVRARARMCVRAARA